MVLSFANRISMKRACACFLIFLAILPAVSTRDDEIRLRSLFINYNDYDNVVSAVSNPTRAHFTGILGILLDQLGNARPASIGLLHVSTESNLQFLSFTCTRDCQPVAISKGRGPPVRKLSIQ